MGWVEDDATIKAILHRDGREAWRDIKTSIRQAVDDYTRIYSPPGAVEIQYAACVPTTDNCIRVRIVPNPGEQDKSFEIRFDPEQQRYNAMFLSLSSRSRSWIRQAELLSE